MISLKPAININRNINNSLSAKQNNTPSFGLRNASSINHEFNRIIQGDKLNPVRAFLNIKDGFFRTLAEKIAENSSQRRNLMVSGMSGSGKSTAVQDAAKVISEKLVTFINGDNFYVDNSENLKKAGGNFSKMLENGVNLDIPAAVRLKEMAKSIEKLLKGEDIKIPEYDYATCKVIDDIIPVKSPEKGGIIIGDTIFAHHSEFDSVRDIGLYVHCPDKEIKKRWYDRIESRGTSGKAADDLFAKVMKEANTHIRPGYDKADILLNGMASRETNAKALAELFKVITDAK